jgi:hypothetical protein
MSNLCKKCGAKHGMGIEDTSTGEITPIDVCRECLFSGTRYLPVSEAIELHAEWGGSLMAMIDGKPKNLADHLNELEKKIIENG